MSSQTVSYSKRASFEFQDSPFPQKGISGKYHTSDMSKQIAEKHGKNAFTSPSILSVSNLLSPIPVSTEQPSNQYANQGSKLDLEPNPFEQSFGTATTDGTSANDTGVITPKSILPPISSIDSPQPLKNSHPWGEHSLRSGPLSPSMLIGPQNQNGFTRPTAFSPFGTQPSPMTAALLGAAGQVTTNFLNNLPNNPLQLKVSDVDPSMNLKRTEQNPTPLSNIPNMTIPSQLVSAFQSINHPTHTSTQVNLSTAGQADFKGHDKRTLAKVTKTLSAKTQNNKTKSPSPSGRRKSTVSLASTDGKGGTDEDSDHHNQNKKTKIEDPGEKRKNFLERNRQAALKCRQRKKQWLNNLQEQVEYFTQENEQLQSQATALREEIINLKTLLIAHKDCPVAQSNGVRLDLGPLTNTITGPTGNPQRINPAMSMPLMQNSMNLQPVAGISSMHSSQMHPTTSNSNIMRF